tara:strand:- start:33548 stop:34225 length:678 start_codon:yes stop_codon:yes gene_type:complete
MEKYLTTLLFICITSNCLSQIHEIGFFAGGVNYVGDVGRTNYIHPNNIGGSFLYKYNLNPRMAIRGNYSYFSITGNDADSKNIIRQERGYSFKNPINEFAVGIEYNFYEYYFSSKNKFSTPYILVQLAAVDYATPRIQNTDGSYVFTRNTSISIPFGLGFKTRLYGKIAFAIETTFRYTFIDDIDYTSNNFPQLDFGGTSNDWYMFTGISFVYTFGRPPCFADER